MLGRPAREGEAVTSQGHPYGIFRKAIRRGNVLAAVAAARELPQLSLVDALDLTLLAARRDPVRHPRVAARWLARYLDEHPAATIEQAALAATCLAALPGASHREDAETLRTMAEAATSRRRTQGLA